MPRSMWWIVKGRHLPEAMTGVTERERLRTPLPLNPPVFHHHLLHLQPPFFHPRFTDTGKVLVRISCRGQAGYAFCPKHPLRRKVLEEHSAATRRSITNIRTHIRAPYSSWKNGVIGAWVGLRKDKEIVMKDSAVQLGLFLRQPHDFTRKLRT